MILFCLNVMYFPNDMTVFFCGFWGTSTCNKKYWKSLFLMIYLFLNVMYFQTKYNIVFFVFFGVRVPVMRNMKFII